MKLQYILLQVVLILYEAHIILGFNQIKNGGSEAQARFFRLPTRRQRTYAHTTKPTTPKPIAVPPQKTIHIHHYFKNQGYQYHKRPGYVHKQKYQPIPYVFHYHDHSKTTTKPPTIATTTTTPKPIGRHRYHHGSHHGSHHKGYRMPSYSHGNRGRRPHRPNYGGGYGYPHKSNYQNNHYSSYKTSTKPTTTTTTTTKMPRYGYPAKGYNFGGYGHHSYGNSYETTTRAPTTTTTTTTRPKYQPYRHHSTGYGHHSYGNTYTTTRAPATTTTTTTRPTFQPYRHHSTGYGHHRYGNSYETTRAPIKTTTRPTHQPYGYQSAGYGLNGYSSQFIPYNGINTFYSQSTTPQPETTIAPTTTRISYNSNRGFMPFVNSYNNKRGIKQSRRQTTRATTTEIPYMVNEYYGYSQLPPMPYAPAESYRQEVRVQKPRTRPGSFATSRSLNVGYSQLPHMPYIPAESYRPEVQVQKPRTRPDSFATSRSLNIGLGDGDRDTASSYRLDSHRQPLPKNIRPFEGRSHGFYGHIDRRDQLEKYPTIVIDHRSAIYDKIYQLLSEMHGNSNDSISDIPPTTEITTTTESDNVTSRPNNLANETKVEVDQMLMGLMKEAGLMGSDISIPMMQSDLVSMVEGNPTGTTVTHNEDQNTEVANPTAITHDAEQSARTLEYFRPQQSGRAATSQQSSLDLSGRTNDQDQRWSQLIEIEHLPSGKKWSAFQ